MPGGADSAVGALHCFRFVIPAEVLRATEKANLVSKMFPNLSGIIFQPVSSCCQECELEK